MKALMKAIVKYDNVGGASELREVPVPQILKDEVLVKVEYAGICGSDVHIYHSMTSYPPSVNVPLIQGHEASGIIEEVGGEVSHLEVGDRVTFETHTNYCGECFYCKRGYYNHCCSRKGLGAGVDGVFAEYVKVPSRTVHKLPESITLKQAAIVEPTAIAYNCVVRHTKVTPGDTVAVIGAGTMGLMAMAMLKIMGPSEIVVLGTANDQFRMDVAKRMGATATVNIQEISNPEIIEKYTDGHGFDIVVDAAGNSRAFQSAVELVRPEGQVTRIGMDSRPLDVSLDPLLMKSATLNTSFSHTWDCWERSIILIDKGMICAEDIVTHELPLEEFKKGIEYMDELTGIKILLKP